MRCTTGTTMRASGLVGAVEWRIRSVVCERTGNSRHREEVVSRAHAARVHDERAGALRIRRVRPPDTPVPSSLTGTASDAVAMSTSTARARRRRLIDDADAIGERRQRGVRQPGARPRGKERRDVAGQAARQPRPVLGRRRRPPVRDPSDSLCSNTDALMEIGRLAVRPRQALAAAAICSRCAMRREEDREGDQHFDERESMRRIRVPLIVIVVTVPTALDSLAPCACGRSPAALRRRTPSSRGRATDRHERSSRAPAARACARDRRAAAAPPISG